VPQPGADFPHDEGIAGQLLHGQLLPSAQGMGPHRGSSGTWCVRAQAMGHDVAKRRRSLCSDRSNCSLPARGPAGMGGIKAGEIWRNREMSDAELELITTKLQQGTR
jgi:hypothetical protein